MSAVANRACSLDTACACCDLNSTAQPSSRHTDPHTAHCLPPRRSHHHRLGRRPDLRRVFVPY